jgi:hypothetical protein
VTVRPSLRPATSRGRLERCDDRARSFAPFRARTGQPRERLPRRIQLRDSGVKRRDPIPCQRSDLRTIGAGIEIEQRLDLGEREARTLRSLDEAQPLDIPVVIASEAAVDARSAARRRRQQTAGVLMISGALKWLSIPVALVIGTIGAVSVFKAVYIDKRELKCACVGGDSNVPLGFVSLTENLIMIAMAVWMLAAH